MRIAAVCLVAALALAPAALAAPQQDWDDCTASDADVSITGCSRIIALGDEFKNNTAIAYFDRGAHQHKGEHQDAIADFNQSLKLNPDDPADYRGRGFSFAQTEEYDLAIADYNRTIELKPD